MEFKDNLKLIRKNKKITQKELANLLGKNQVTIARYETGDIIPPLSVIEQIAKVLDITTDELLTTKTKLWNFSHEDLTSKIDFEKIEQIENELSKKLLKISNEELAELFYLKYGLKLTEIEKKELCKEVKNYIEYSLNKIKNIQILGQEKEPQE